MSDIRNFLKLFCLFLFGFFLIIILSGVFFYKAEFCMVKYGDIPVLIKQNLRFLIIGICTSALIYSLLWLLLKKVWLLLFIIFIILQISVIFYFRVNLTADWKAFYGIAQEILTGDFSELKPGGYLYAYPHNLGITLYYVILNILAPANLYFPRILNVLYSTVTIFLTNRIFLLLNPVNVRYKKHFFVFSLLFIPPIFMTNLVYNEVLSTMLFLAGVYLCVKFINQKKMRLLIGIAFLFSFGNFIRSLGFLFAAASVLYFLLMKVNLKTITLFAVAMVIGFVTPLWFINWQLYSRGKIEEPLGKNSVPILKWIHMGLTKTYFGYWDQGESYYMYARDTSWNKKEANKIYYEGIKHKIKEYGGLGIVNIYFKKLVWLWTEGTYQSVYLGMSHSNPDGYIEETTVSRFFEQKIENRDFIKIMMYFENLISLMAIFIFVGFIISSRRWELINTEMILILILLIFICFYLLWEVKPRYIYPIYPYILLLSCISIIKLFNYKKQKL